MILNLRLQRLKRREMILKKTEMRLKQSLLYLHPNSVIRLSVQFVWRSPHQDQSIAAQMDTLSALTARSSTAPRADAECLAANLSLPSPSLITLNTSAEMKNVGKCFLLQNTRST